MASVQAVQVRSKQAVIQAISQNVINHKQSLEVVQTLLLTSISSIAYLRQLFPDSTFEDRIYSSPATYDTYHSYQDFVDGTKLPNISANQHTIGTPRPLKIMVRGCYAPIDQLLDCLELGIFDALKKNYLAALQLTIFENKINPSNVFEAYTFSFQYAGNARDDSLRLAGMQLEDQAGKATVRDVKHGLQLVVRRLVQLSTILPELPATRFLTIHLFYTEDCPEKYEPEGFRRCEDGSIRFPDHPDLLKQTTSCGFQHTGFHRVSLRVRSVDWIESEEHGLESAARIPSNLTYGSELPRTDDIGMSDDEVGESHSFAAQHSNKDTDKRRYRISKEIEKANRVTDEQMKEALRRMNPLDPLTQSSSLVPTLLLTQDSGSLCQAPNNQDPLPKDIFPIKLSQAKADELRFRREQLHVGRQYRDARNEPEKVVHCECNWNREEGDMMVCECCGRWQHLQCYGFLETQDIRAFASHVCYTCLLAENEKVLLHDMTILSLFRRALIVILEYGYPMTNTNFANLLHCDRKTAHEVTRRLRAEGYLTATPGSHSKGFSQKNLPKYLVARTKAQMEEMRKNYFNPLVHIAHHYTLTQANSRNTAVTLATDQSAGKPGIPQARNNIGREETIYSGRRREHADSTAASATRIYTQDSYPNEGTASQSVASELQPLSSPQRKRAPDNGRKEGGRKRMKSSNMAQPIDIGKED